jgi:hypothetical protein
MDAGHFVFQRERLSTTWNRLGLGAGAYSPRVPDRTPKPNSGILRKQKRPNIPLITVRSLSIQSLVLDKVERFQQRVSITTFLTALHKAGIDPRASTTGIWKASKLCSVSSRYPLRAQTTYRNTSPLPSVFSAACPFARHWLF